MLGKFERLKNEFIEVLLRRQGKIDKFEIDRLNEYTQFIALKMEEANASSIVHNRMPEM